MLPKRITWIILTVLAVGVLLPGCKPPPEGLTATATAQNAGVATKTPTIAPTQTIEPSPTPTIIPSPTPLPGTVVIPIDTLGHGYPWLPYDESSVPGVNFVVFNTQRPPFDRALVRQAFAHAIDRQVVVQTILGYVPADTSKRPATTFTPPEVLGRDLYGEVGAEFNPQRARELLAQAGYSDPSEFPATTFLVNISGGAAPYGRYHMASAMADMWLTHLGVSVQVEAISPWHIYLDTISGNTPDLYWLGWLADDIDPDNFLRVGVLQSSAQHGGFSNSEYERLVNLAMNTTDPEERQILYILAERILCETEAALIPIYHSTQ